MSPIKRFGRGRRRDLGGPTLNESRAIIAYGVVAVVIWLSFATYMRHYFRFPSGVNHPEIPDFFERPEDAMPLPRTLDPSQFENKDLREAYMIARDLPALLAQQPCYCRANHFPSLLHCFSDLAGSRCDVCVEEAKTAAKLYTQGESVGKIRQAIIRIYGRNVAIDKPPSN